MSFLKRLRLALQILFRDALPEGQGPHAAPGANKALPADAAPPVGAPSPSEFAESAALHVLSLLQREGRLIDFLKEDVTGFSDEQVGAAARVVHEGCRKALHQYLEVMPIRSEPEGARITVPLGFDAARLQLTGAVTGSGPWTGSLKHHGWVATTVRFPAPARSGDARVLAPAEVELSA